MIALAADGAGRVTARVVAHIADVPAGAWDRCAGDDDPFVSHAFLNALEESGSVAPGRGFRPHHLLLEDRGGRLLGAVPLYLRSHSYAGHGPDAHWEPLFRRGGQRYYPKLQAEVPYMPYPGPRLLISPDTDREGARAALVQGMLGVAKKLKVSSLHVGFANSEDAALLDRAGFLQSHQPQYVWRNRGYESYEDFVASLLTRKRKQIRRDRRRALASGLRIERLTGAAITSDHWDAFHDFHQNTNLRQGTTTYLTPEFFHRLGATLADRVLLVVAMDGPTPIAGCLNLIGTGALLNRYWGGITEHPSLHFEVSYHQAIEYAIEHGLERIDAGPGGTHKLDRGFLPEAAVNAHWFLDPDMRDAIGGELTKHRRAFHDDLARMRELSPYRSRPTAETGDIALGEKGTRIDRDAMQGAPPSANRKAGA